MVERQNQGFLAVVDSDGINKWGIVHGSPEFSLRSFSAYRVPEKPLSANGHWALINYKIWALH